MERTKRNELESVVVSQKEQLLRYEKRLKDVVAAYKGLLKEKEALETSLSAITASKPQSTAVNRPTADAKDAGASNEKQENSMLGPSAANSNDDDHLQTQIMALMNSLATLSSEKSRMEASFQADKKQLRALLAQKDQNIAELQTKIKTNEERSRADVDEVKAKWIIERQEREKETNNQMLMIRELQKLYADERHLKENIEMQLNNFKTQFASNETENSRRELLTQLKDAKAQLKQLHTKSTSPGGESDDLADSAAAVLRQLHQEMHQLKEQHAVAIKNEQTRVLRAEEQSRKQAALHEDRVANLESRLAELSSTVGTYDRLRQQDQNSIQGLKKQLHELELCSDATTKVHRNEDSGEQRQRRKCSIPQHDVAAILEEIVRLKKLLVNENARSAHPIDDVSGVEHVECQEELNRVQQKCEAGKLEMAQLLDQMQVQKSHISTLQEKVKVLNRNIDDQELELKQQTEKLRQATKTERTKWRDTLAEMENDFRCKVNDLEQQLQKQRQRSLQLLDEKEQEIKTLQTSFEVFHSSAMPSVAHTMNSIEPNVAASSDAESVDEGQSKLALKSKKLSVGENCHMLHYANEIARKDIEIANLRKAKYAAETSLRKAIQEKVNAQEDLCDQIATLEEQVDRLERCKTREGANLEYLKNVIISFIVTKDLDGKRHMMNAISAVLQFTPAEIQAINAAAFHKK